MLLDAVGAVPTKLLDRVVAELLMLPPLMSYVVGVILLRTYSAVMGPLNRVLLDIVRVDPTNVANRIPATATSRLPTEFRKRPVEASDENLNAGFDATPFGRVRRFPARITPPRLLELAPRLLMFPLLSVTPPILFDVVEVVVTLPVTARVVPLKVRLVCASAALEDVPVAVRTRFAPAF
jgi:hypothetical protein